MLQLMGVACMLIAAKYEEVCVLDSVVAAAWTSSCW